MTIAAVVVTHNRKELLSRCLDAIIRQTRCVQKIYVIDNASSDGTYEYLGAHAYLENSKIGYHRMRCNSGSAGGFSFGIRVAMEDGFDYMWTMDDDGLPADTCLEELFQHRDGRYFLSPFVISETGEIGERLQCMLSLKGVSKNGDMIFGYAYPMNGILLSRRLIEDVGFPDAKYFIRGEENEYLLRAQQQGYQAVTAMRAHFYHKIDELRSLPFQLGTVFVAPTLHTYCYYRNYYHIFEKYYGVKFRNRWLKKEIIKRCILCEFHTISIMIRAIKDAARNTWGGETRYLQ